MGIDDRIKKHGKVKSGNSSHSRRDFRDRFSRRMQRMKVEADYSDSRPRQIAVYGGLAAVGTASFLAGMIYKTGGIERALEYIGGLSAKVKTGIGIATLATAAGTGVYIVNQTDTTSQPTRPGIENRLPEPAVINYRITETDIKKQDILYELLESRFGYTVRDEIGNYVPLRTTRHHSDNPETFLDAFRRLNPELYRELTQREREAGRPGDQSFQYLRPGDEIKFLSAK